ncbi:MAG: PHP domain-containing protein [Methanothrix sp.]|nr:PHP domain-containing protein [Methanothrix sp.]
MISDSATGMLSSEEADALREDGWMAADLHVHTLFSSDVIPVSSLRPMRLFQKARAKHMDFVTFTDHDAMAAYRSISPKLEGLVRGVEIKIKDIERVGHTIHINVYELDDSQFHELENIALQGDLLSFLDFLKSEKLPFVYNHPLWFEAGEKPNLAVIPDLIKLFPVLEYNMHRIRRKNEIIMELARRYEKGLIASTDTHSGMIGHAYTLSKGNDFKEFYNNICLGKSYIIVKDLTKQYLIQEMNAWLDMISGQEPILKNKKICTGMRYLDKFIAIMSSEKFRDFPRMYGAALTGVYKAANSGLPAALYIWRECSSAFEMEKILGPNCGNLDSI